jgi:uncharacterized protein YndB with AHSA1/START domain
VNDGLVDFSVPPVVKTITVRCTPENAFRVFTEEIGAWWPLDTHSIGPSAETCVFERREGGRLFERLPDGTEHLWGTVVLWQPPRRLAFTWQLTRPAEQAQRVDVAFDPCPGGTRVQLTHSGWERLADKARGMRDSYDKGWGKVFEQCYAGRADAAG